MQLQGNRLVELDEKLFDVNLPPFFQCLDQEIKYNHTVDTYPVYPSPILRLLFITMVQDVQQSRCACSSEQHPFSVFFRSALPHAPPGSSGLIAR